MDKSEKVKTDEVKEWFCKDWPECTCMYMLSSGVCRKRGECKQKTKER